GGRRSGTRRRRSGRPGGERSAGRGSPRSGARPDLLGGGTLGGFPPSPPFFASPPSQSRAGLQVLGPVLEAREILPRELALSEGGRALEERHVDHGHALGLRGLRHLLRHHLS